MVSPGCLHAVAELGIADALEESPRSAEELPRDTGQMRERWLARCASFRLRGSAGKVDTQQDRTSSRQLAFEVPYVERA